MCSIDIINANILAKKPVAEDKNASLRCFDGRIMKPTARRGVVVADGTLVHASEQENPTRSGLHVLLGWAFSAPWFASI